MASGERPRVPSLPGRPTLPSEKLHLPERGPLPGVTLPPRWPWEKEEAEAPAKPPEEKPPAVIVVEKPPERAGWESFTYEVYAPTKSELGAVLGLDIREFEIDEENHVVYLRCLEPLTLDERDTIKEIIRQKQPGPEWHGPAQAVEIPTAAEAERKAAAPSRIVQPIPSLDWTQIFNAIQLFDPDADVHQSYDAVAIAASGSGWVDAFTVPSDRLYIARFFFEWGDACLKTKYAIDTSDRVATEEHYVAPYGQVLQLRKYLPARDKIMLWYQNTDTVRTAELHVSMFQIAPRTKDWQRWEERFKSLSRRLLGEE